ncbi:MAG: PDZ domain-containing protein, partial [Planctomycetes bacterium]|nr:PDZ domain-containing protein [Planctomycetota bacterium]
FSTESGPNQQGLTLHRYKPEDREAEEVMSGVFGYDVSHDGQKLLYAMPDDVYGIVDATGTPKPGDGKIATNEMRAKVDPSAEWRQIFREAIRYQRDYFYVENVHGLDLTWAEETYGAWLPHVRHRADLNYVLDILGGETVIGHSFVFGGDTPDVETVPVGLLGADLEVDAGRYRIARIYTGESWNPNLHAPLSGPGIDVSEGAYLLAVDGRELTAAMNPYSLFDRTSGKQTVLRIGDEPTMDGSREITVVPVTSEQALRRQAWIEDNRRRVGVKIAHGYVPGDPAAAGGIFKRMRAPQAKGSAILIGSQLAHALTELFVADLFKCKAFAPMPGKVPFYLRFGDKAPVTSCFGGTKAPPGYKASAGPGIYYRAWSPTAEKDVWVACPSTRGREDAGVVIVRRDSGEARTEMAVFGFSGQATAALGDIIRHKPDEFWDFSDNPRRGLEVRVYICTFEMTEAPAGQGGAVFVKNEKIIPLHSSLLPVQ